MNIELQGAIGARAGENRSKNNNNNKLLLKYLRISKDTYGYRFNKSFKKVDNFWDKFYFNNLENSLFLKMYF